MLGDLLKSGKPVAVIEGKEVGGSCVNTGCTPTKTLVGSVKALQKVKTAHEYGIKVSNYSVDFERVFRRMNDMRHGSRDGFTEWLKTDKRIDFYAGYATFNDKKELQVNGEKISGQNIFIHTGARARKLPLPGIDSIDWLDNEKLLNLKQLPGHLIVVGGSYIGLEFAQIFRRLGSQVSVIEAARQIMFREDADIAESARSILTEEGIAIYEGSKIKMISSENNVSVSLEHNGKEITLQGTHLLLATGRQPNTENLNLEKAGIETDEKGFIKTDEYLRTNVDGVFAVGDVNGKGAFTHTSVHDGQIVLDFLNGSKKRKSSDRHSIYAMFIDPPLARIGLSEKEAIEKGYNILKAVHPMSKINRAREMGETSGMIKVIADADSKKILGAAILGSGGDEIINFFAPFLYFDLRVEDLQKMVLVHPTVSELLPFILENLKPV